MPAVVRVKRRIDEEPLSAFILNGKRRRLEEESASALTNKEELSTLLKFAGTIKEQDDTATTQFARLSKEEAKELVLQKNRKPSNATDKLRQEMRQHQHEHRFRVVNCLRTTVDKDNANATSKEVTIVDIEKHVTNDKTVQIPKSTTSNTNLVEASTSSAAAAAVTAAALTMPTDADTGYVYDLYIPDNEQQADYVDLMDDNYLSVRVFDDLIYEDRYNNDDEEYDSEDSNQENYIGNEYPDEDEEYENEDNDSTINLRYGLQNFVFGDDEEEYDDENFYDSSSDDGGFHNAYRDPYVHSIDVEEESFCNDVDSCYIYRYGMSYARYKARILKEFSKVANDYEEEDTEDEDNTEDEDDTDEEVDEAECTDRDD